MKKLDQLADGSNAYTFSFEKELLAPIKSTYKADVEPYLKLQNPQLLKGGNQVSLEMPGNSSLQHYIYSYGAAPLLWVSNNNRATYNLYLKFFKQLAISEAVKNLVDYDKDIVMYSGFLVVGNLADQYQWHVDYFPGANAFTLITPLQPLNEEHGNLIYESTSGSQEKYKYEYGEAIIFGDNFKHSTELYEQSDDLRVLVSLTFGTDKMKYWPILQNTIGDQSKFMILPCGHQYGKCRCIAKEHAPQKTGRNAPCHCGSGKKFKHCHGNQ